MPCGQPCKEVIDGAAALVQCLTCMSNSILLNAANGGSGPPPGLRRKVMQAMSDMGTLAQEVAAATPVDGAGEGIQ